MNDSEINSRRGLIIWGVIAAMVASLVVYGLWAIWIALRTGQGALPPESRDPEVPGSARIIRKTDECGPTICYRELLVESDKGSNAIDLAFAMGVESPSVQGWSWNDPHTVSIFSTVRGEDRLAVSVSYNRPPPIGYVSPAALARLP